MKIKIKKSKKLLKKERIEQKKLSVDPYTLGQKAFWSEISKESNPYLKESDEFERWLDGWLDEEYGF